MRVYVDGPDHMDPLYFDTIKKARDWLFHSDEIRKYYLSDYDIMDDEKFFITQADEYDEGEGWPYESYSVEELRKRHRVMTRDEMVKRNREKICAENERIKKRLYDYAAKVGIRDNILNIKIWHDQISIIFSKELDNPELKLMTSFIKEGFGEIFVDSWMEDDAELGRICVLNFIR